MFLKSLEINGFKSFAGKSVLEFPSGITAIVGPNGSGKSNIIDAIRWLLGEREIKNLRGGKTEDLIFNGTPKRPRAGMAQASLCFDNESGFFPVDYKEVVITRRISRDGDSEYLLNRTEIKLKDLVEFLNRSRLGTKGLVIVNQGQSDIFVKASSEARRIMIEEILGLREYQSKKSEAERKLKATSENLEKVRAMAGEVLPRLKMLNRQTEKWSKRAAIEDDLRELEDKFFSYKFCKLEDERSAISPSIRKLEENIKEKRKKLELLESDLNKLERGFEEPEELRSMREEKKRIFEERREIERELGGIEAKIEIMSVREEKEGHHYQNEELFGLIGEIKEKLHRAIKESKDISVLRSIVAEMIERIESFFGEKNNKEKNHPNAEEIAVLEDKRRSIMTAIVSFDKKAEALERREAEITTGLKGFNAKFRKALGIIESERREMHGFEDEKRRLEFEAEKISMRFADLNEEITQAGRKKEEFLSAVSEGKGDWNIADAERKIFRFRAELSAIGEIDASLVKEAEEVKKHYDFLISQSDDLERAAADLTSLIKELAGKIHREFHSSLRLINKEFEKFFKLMFKGGEARLKVSSKNGEVAEIGEESDSETESVVAGVEIELKLPEKRVSSLEMLSGGEKSLVSIAALFAMISVSPPPFLVLDEIDAALDENNSRRLAELVKESSKHSQFVIVTHNRSMMESADVLYGVTVGDDGVSKLLSLKLE